MSAPFRFGLQRVRDLRAHDEDAAKEQFASSLSQRLRGEAMLRAAEQEVREARLRDPAAGLGPVSGNDLLVRQAWVDRLERSRQDAAHRLRGLDAQLAASKAELAEASRRREVLDQLRERQQDAHRREAARVESNELDEMAQGMYARRRSAA